MNLSKRIALFAGPALGVILGLVLRQNGIAPEAASTAGITCCCAIWWVFEPIPVPATAMIPFGFFPLAGVMKHTEVAASYGHHLVLLMMGGFMISSSMEHTGAHRRLALGMVKAVGGRGGRRIVLGFMLASAALSMWITNAATTLMLLPVALAVLDQSSEREQLATPLLLGIAYAASLGGMGTPIGTPPNLIFVQQYQETTGVEVSFLKWMGMAMPVVLAMIPITWLWLTRRLRGSQAFELKKLEPWTAAEVLVLSVFAITAVAWMTRTGPYGGWSQLLANPKDVGDSTVALVAGVTLFLIPDGKGKPILNWERAERIPWGLLLLLGGGIAIGKAFQASGLSQVIGHQLKDLTSLSLVLMVALLCLGVTFMTEMTSNTATTNLLMPILAAAGQQAEIDPAKLMLPAVISASCAFMLPVATVPNAIIYGSREITVKTMAREGIVLNLIGVIVVTTVCLLVL